jgi:post-segregation antitoxin (ccd killing protein)
MQIYTEKQMRRKNFFLSLDLDNRAAAVAKHLDLDFSELVRVALSEFVQRREREREEEELAKACENYREFNKRFSPGWAKFETRIK